MQRGLCSRASATAPASSVPKAAAWPAFSFQAALPPLCRRRRRRKRVIYPRPLVGRPDETKARRNALLAVVGRPPRECRLPCSPRGKKEAARSCAENGNKNSVLFSAGRLRALPAKLNGGRLGCFYCFCTCARVSPLAFPLFFSFLRPGGGHFVNGLCWWRISGAVDRMA